MRAETRVEGAANQRGEAPPIWRRLRELGPELGAEWHAVSGAGPQSDPPPEPVATGEARIIEGDGAFRVYETDDPGASQFGYFLDGIEMTRVCGYVGTVPIVHGYVAAVIRQRRARSFLTWDLREEEILAFPYALLPPERFSKLGVPERSLVDSKVEADSAHPIRMAELGRLAVKRRRGRLEATLGRRWAGTDTGDGWLLVDGRLAIDPVLLESGRAIGLVKSHRTQFLDGESMRRVLTMDAGRRSPVFEPVRPEIGEVYSWYVRLRSPAQHDIYWALARIEGRAESRTIEIADDVSRWLLAETAPLSLPDPRWHVLLYPIRDCESYLRARMPTLDVGP